jgi:hypothetical protein
MRTHTANGVEIACRRETAGSCRMCDLSDPASPHYRADYAALYGGATTHTVTAAAPVPDTAMTYGIPLAGDLVAAFTARVGADRAAKWVAAKLGFEDCHCAERQQKLNELDKSIRKYLNRFGGKP